MKKHLLQVREFLGGEVSAVPLATYRIFFGIIALANAWFLLPDRFTWFSDSGVLPMDLARSHIGADRLNLFLWFGAGENVVEAVFWINVFSAIGVTIGLFTRVSTVCFFLTLVSLHHRNTFILNSGDMLMRLMAFWMMFSRCGQVLSVDSWLKREIPAPKIPAGPVRCMQLQVCVLYFCAFCLKMLGNMWRDGTAVGAVSHLEQFSRFPVLFLSSSWGSHFFSWFTLAVESLFPFLIWIKQTRRWILAIALFLHLSLEYSMNIQLFQFSIMITFVLFLEEKEIRALFPWQPRVAFPTRAETPT